VVGGVVVRVWFCHLISCIPILSYKWLLLKLCSDYNVESNGGGCKPCNSAKLGEGDHSSLRRPIEYLRPRHVFHASGCSV
jgi:hypothetical protein